MTIFTELKIDYLIIALMIYQIIRGHKSVPLTF